MVHRREHLRREAVLRVVVVQSGRERSLQSHEQNDLPENASVPRKEQRSQERAVDIGQVLVLPRVRELPRDPRVALRQRVPDRLRAHSAPRSSPESWRLRETSSRTNPSRVAIGVGLVSEQRYPVFRRF